MATTRVIKRTVTTTTSTGKDPQRDNPQEQGDHPEELGETQQRDIEKDKNIEIVETVEGKPEQTHKIGQATEKEVLEGRELTPQIGLDIEDQEPTLQTDRTREKLEEIGMIQEKEEKIRGVEEGIMIQDIMETTQMTVLEEKIEEGIAGGIMIPTNRTQPATETPEMSARRFHTWGNLQ